MVDSLWLMVDSLWLMVDSLWLMVDSLWLMLDSWWLMVAFQRHRVVAGSLRDDVARVNKRKRLTKSSRLRKSGF